MIMNEMQLNKIKDDYQRLQYILDTEEGLIFPQSKRKDVFWLLRNFHISNSNHPDFDYIMNLIRKIAIQKTH